MSLLGWPKEARTRVPEYMPKRKSRVRYMQSVTGVSFLHPNDMNRFAACRSAGPRVEPSR
jgi:hypothetical protein